MTKNIKVVVWDPVLKVVRDLVYFRGRDDLGLEGQKRQTEWGRGSILTLRYRTLNILLTSCDKK